ncbi:hypothetical protein Tco_0697778 [Tanacetum coccineum]
MTRSSNTKVLTPFANPERQFQNRKDVTPIAVHNIYSFYESELSGSESEEVSEIDIEILTIEQYLALNRNDTSDDIMLQVFPLTLIGSAKRWLGRTSPRTIRSWDGLKQGDGESLHQTWERYNDLLFKCPFNDLNDYQKVNTFYNGLGLPTRQILDSRGQFPGLTTVKALELI